MKLGLLRSLASDDLVLGVNWYLSPDESHNADGKHISYLVNGNAIGSKLKGCDPDLFAALATMVSSGHRSVAALEGAAVLPRGTKTYVNPLRRGMTPTERRAWHHEAMASFGNSELVFMDPDNGLRSEPGPKLEKFALASEVGEYFARGQSVIVYHHADRSKGGVPLQVERRLREIESVIGCAPLGAVVARRGSCRFFLVAAQPLHRDKLEDRLAVYGATWQGHADVVTRDQA
jgi:hypothetical protein